MATDASPPVSTTRGLSDVQLSAIVVQGLFGKYTHKIPLPTSPGNESSPSVLILYGLNGVGKTTVLRMLDGLIRLDFDVFREMPFESCYLELSTGARLVVQSRKNDLLVTFEDFEVALDREIGKKGSKDPKDTEVVEALRERFFSSIENISFNFVQTSRTRMDEDVESDEHLVVDSSGRVIQSRRRGRESSGRQQLARKVQGFIQEAQLDASRFFGTSGPDLFSRIIEDLSHVGDDVTDVESIRKQIELVHARDAEHERLGLHTDSWNYSQLTELMQRPNLSSDIHSLAVLSTYADFLSSRSNARQLIADRLRTFENLMRELFVDKEVLVDRKIGLRIVSDGLRLTERRLSSGEYQMLYLMVAALTTHRKGTVLAIDEPEISMHPSWQRKLVRSLVKCASGAAPQIILATHSPDVSMDYSESMVELVRA